MHNVSRSGSGESRAQGMPEHLMGTRAGIFFLLNAEPGPAPAAAAAPAPKPRPRPEPAPRPPRPANLWADLFEAEYFIFDD